MVFLLAGLACGSTEDIDTASTWSGVAPEAPRLLEPATIDLYKRALPQVEYPRLAEIFASPSTLWFDKEVMIPSYQDSVGDASTTPIGARPNAGGRRIIVQEGRRLFTEDGLHWSFPFSQTAGTDRVPNALVVNFMSLPVEADALLPVVYETIDDPRGRRGLGLHQWKWMFPKGTVMGEVIYLSDSTGDLYAVEIRTRTRYLTDWAVNVYRPFPTAARMASAIKAARPNWESQPNLQVYVRHLEDDTTLTPRRIPSPGFRDIVVLEGFEDILPPLGDEALVRELLRSTTFVSAYGHFFKMDSARVAFAASAADSEPFSLVPSRYDAGVLEVREASCGRCHENAGQSIESFEPAAILYGDLWGEDRIFSFHPWDQTRYPTFNTENRSVRPALAPVVVRYDRARHPADRYAWIR